MCHHIFRLLLPCDIEIDRPRSSGSIELKGITEAGAYSSRPSSSKSAEIEV